MTEHAVVIAGGGPTGMMLAAELALAKVDVAVLERRPDQVLAGSRGGGLHSRSIEVLDQRGVADRFLAEGKTAQVATFGSAVLDMSDFPTRHPYSLALFQNLIERIMAEWIAELPVRTYYGSEVTGFAQDDTGAVVELAEGRSLRAQYLVGCDGGRSLIRRAAGIEFPGWEATKSNLIAEAELTEEPPAGGGRAGGGAAKRPPPRRHRRPRPAHDGGREDGAGRRDREGDRVQQRAHPARAERGAHHGVRYRLRGPQPHVDLEVQRRDTSGSRLPRWTSPTCRRLGARALPGGRTGAQPRP